MAEELNLFLDRKYGIPNEDIATNSPLGECYPGLSLAALQTGYREYARMLDILGPHKLLCDLGAGYARGSFLACDRGWDNCFSVEIDKERFQHVRQAFETRNFPIDRVINADICEIDYSSFDAFFFYFPLGRKFMESISKLWQLAKQKHISIFVIESHGDMIPFLKNLSFLDECNRWPLSQPRHDPYLYQFNVKPVSPSNMLEEFLASPNSDQAFIYEYEHMLLETKVQWLIPFRKASLQFHQGKFYLEFLPLHRLISLDELLISRKLSPKELKLTENDQKLLLQENQYIEERGNRMVFIN